MPELEPVSGDPFLQPVSGDPFAEGMTLQGNVAEVAAKLEAEQAARKSTLGSLAARYTLPGRLVAGVQPETPGTMTEEDAYRQNQLEAEAQGWGPEQAAAMLKTGVPFAKPGTIGAAGGGIKAYHGSPHDFEKFDVSKIGTGEGAQAYGHGLYFAEAEPTAQSYRPGPVADVPHEYSPEVRSTIDAVVGMKDPASSLKNQIEILKKNIGKATEQRDKEMLGYSLHVRQRALEALESGKVAIKPRGSMYEVNINADPEHFLDWDKPLSEQHPKVQEAIKSFGPIRGSEDALYEQALSAGFGKDAARQYAKEQAYEPTGEHLMGQLGRNEHGAQKLREAGIPGIKYLDQGSRGSYTVAKRDGDWGILRKDGGDWTPHRFTDKAEADAKAQWMNEGEKTHNYVVFHHDLIDIIKKYGLAGLIAGGAAHFKTQPHDGDPFADSQ